MPSIVADYRVKTRQNAKPADCVADAKACVRWVRANAARLGIDCHIYAPEADSPAFAVAAGSIAGLPASDRIEAGFATLADVLDMPVLKDEEARRPMARQKRVFCLHLSLYETDHLAVQVNEGAVHPVPLIRLGGDLEIGDAIGDWRSELMTRFSHGGVELVWNAADELLTLARVEARLEEMRLEQAAARVKAAEQDAIIAKLTAKLGRKLLGLLLSLGDGLRAGRVAQSFGVVDGERDAADLVGAPCAGRPRSRRGSARSPPRGRPR